MAYENLAQVYDKIMAEDVDYQVWARYCSEVFKKAHCPGKAIVDLGCGTGGITLEMQRLGWQMCGVDISPAMLKQAQERFAEEKADIKLYCQDIAKLDLPLKFDGALATFDTLNYLTKAEDVSACLKRVGECLNSQGILLFDYNTFFKLADILGDNTYSYYSDDVVYIWENTFDAEEKICEMELTFFIKQDSGFYERTFEKHRQKAYELNEWKSLLEKSGFSFLAAYDQLEFEEIAEEEFAEKVFIVAQKKSQSLEG